MFTLFFTHVIPNCTCLCRVMLLQGYKAVLGKEELLGTGGGGQSGKRDPGSGLWGWVAATGTALSRRAEGGGEGGFSRDGVLQPWKLPKDSQMKSQPGWADPLLSNVLGTGRLSLFFPCCLAYSFCGFSGFFKWNPVFSFMLLSEFTSCPGSFVVLGGGWGSSLSKLWPTWHPAAGRSWNWGSLEVTGFSMANFGSRHCQCCWSVFPWRNSRSLSWTV